MSPDVEPGKWEGFITDVVKSLQQVVSDMKTVVDRNSIHIEKMTENLEKYQRSDSEYYKIVDETLKDCKDSVQNICEELNGSKGLFAVVSKQSESIANLKDVNRQIYYYLIALVLGAIASKSFGWW